MKTRFKIVEPAKTQSQRRAFVANIIKSVCGCDYCGQLESCNGCPLRRKQLFEEAKWTGN